jgi:prenyltransferase beta subunit
MLQVARLAPRPLGDSAGLVADFLRGRLTADGGFADRAGAADLYYTVFGLEGLLALRADVPFPVIDRYLDGFGDGSGLDFVHLACLARCWASMPADLRARAPRDGLLRNVERFRSRDGGFAQTADTDGGADRGTVYAAFLGAASYQDLGVPLPRAEEVIRSVERLRADDGGYANQEDLPWGLTPVTAAAATLLSSFGRPTPPELPGWLLARCRPDGGFFASPEAPLPDLLSTATALHALSRLKADIEPIKEPCLDFVDSLWTNKGAFHGHWADDEVDCEYTYYGLLALGHLSL